MTLENNYLCFFFKSCCLTSLTLYCSIVLSWPSFCQNLNISKNLLYISGTRSGSPTSHDNKSFISTFSEDHFPIKKVDVRIKPVQIPKRIWDLQFKRLFASPTKEEGSRVTRFSTWTPAVEAGILPSAGGQITSSSSDQEASDLRGVSFISSR